MQRSLSKKFVWILVSLFLAMLALTILLFKARSIGIDYYQILLPVVILQHILSALFLGSGIALLYALFIKKEYTLLTFSIKNTLLCLLLLGFLIAISYDSWIELSSPHPLFYDQYWFL